MKKVNFNQLQNFEVPQEWIDKAMNATPKPTPFLRRPYVIGSAIGIGVILVAVVTLILINPFRNNNAQTDAAAASADSAAATQQGASELQAAMTEAETIIKEADETENGDDPEATENQVDETTNADDPEKQTEPETTNDGEDAVKYRIKDRWYVDNRSEKTSDAPVMNDTSLELEKNELFTGDITIVISPNSEFNYAKEIRFAAYIDYEPANQAIEGFGYLEPYEGDNGEKIIRFNLFDEGAYTPSAEGYTFSFNFFDDETDKYGRDMVTVDLVSGNPVTITL